MSIIQINSLLKKYNNNIILDNIDIILDNKYINLIIGSNGCGKSTLLKCINKLVSYGGNIFVEGSLVYMPETINLPDDIKVCEFIKLILEIKKCKENRLDDLINKFNLNVHLNKKISSLSFGTKQKVLLIISLIEDAEIYLFDEPLNGLDNVSIKVFLSEIETLYNSNKIVIIVTHEEERIKLFNTKIIKIEDGKIYV